MLKQQAALQAELDQRRIVGLLWVYFALLIGEGALRKWVLPGWSDALLVARDPIAVAILFLAFRDNLIIGTGPGRGLAAVSVGFVVLALLQIGLGDVLSLPVLLYGLRTYCLHPALIFVIGRVLTGRDLRRMTLVLMLLMLPIALLMVEQFRAAPSDWINTGAGEGRMQIRSALDHIRPPGPFSFISGPVLFYSLGLACLVGSEFGRGRDLFLARCAGWIALVIAVAVAGSRALVVGLVPVLAAVGLGIVMRPNVAGRLGRGAIVAAFIVASVWSSAVVQDGFAVLRARVGEAAGSENVASRATSTYTGAFAAVTDAPLFGYGLGLGTNAGNALLGAGMFRLGEDEWTRVILEAGPLFGVSYLVWRLWLVLWLARGALRAASLGYLFPMLCVGASVGNLVNGNWGQPTTQGFAVWTAGMALAAWRVAHVSQLRPVPLRARNDRRREPRVARAIEAV